MATTPAPIAPIKAHGAVKWAAIDEVRFKQWSPPFCFRRLSKRCQAQFSLPTPHPY